MSTPTPTTLDAIRDAQTALIRKGLAGAVAIASMTASLPTSLTTGAQSQLAPLPSGYSSFGLITKDDGLTWSKDTESSEVTSWGFADPTRRDVIAEMNGLQLTAQETNLTTLEVYENVSLASVTPDATTGEVQFPGALRPQTRYYRVMSIAQDGDGADAIYLGRLLPRAMVSERGEQVWQEGQEIGYQVTLSATPDSTAGYSIRYFFGGPGWKARLADMGFAA